VQEISAGRGRRLCPAAIGARDVLGCRRKTLDNSATAARPGAPPLCWSRS